MGAPTFSLSSARILVLGLALTTLPTAEPIQAQNVSVGTGGYTTSLPSWAAPPQNADNQPATPLVSEAFSQPIQTNDVWSSLLYPFFGDPHSGVLFVHPLQLKAQRDGLLVGHSPNPVFAAQDYLYPFAPQLLVGIDGLNAARTLADRYGDWTVDAVWDDGARELTATFGQGLPYVFFRIQGGDAMVRPTGQAQIRSRQGAVIALEADGRHYALFAPPGSSWRTDGGVYRSDLNGEGYLAVALLPDGSTETLDLFTRHARAFVVDSRVEWAYDAPGGRLTTRYLYETEWMGAAGEDSTAASDNQTLTALYRHHWLHTPQALTSHTYPSPRGLMKLHAGKEFTTELPVQGVLPALPDQGDYNREELLAHVRDAARGTLPVGPTYENGKAMARFANLTHIAQQLGAVQERDHFLSQMKTRLEEWFTPGGAQQYSYLAEWNVLTGYPSGYGADTQINDHHFHSSYAIYTAATIAMFDPDWAAQDKWGGMVNLLIRDSNSWNREDTQFPFLRSHDIYAGHSWASGHGAFGDGNNQESSSESMNFAASVLLWGEVTGQRDIRDLGVFLHTTEASAIEQYWFDVDDEVFPAGYPHVAIGMVWGGKGVHSTWFGAQPEFIHGINLLPITGGSLYLGRHPDHVLANYAEIVNERNGQPAIWKDILWQYLAFADPGLALTYYRADPGYEPFDGESRAHTLHWLHNLKKMGRVDTTFTADTPTYAVFANPGADTTYVAFNAGPDERTVTFSNGFTLRAAPRSLAVHSTSRANPDAPVAVIQADKRFGKVPLRVRFDAEASFDRQGAPLAYNWQFAEIGSSTARDTVFTFPEVGSYLVTLTVTSPDGLTGQDSLRIEVLPNGTPFGGTPAKVPGIIQAEAYDEGGEGIAYHDVDASNIGLAYRPDEGVDLEGANDGGFDVYWIVDGEWIEYTFQVAQEGIYTFIPYVTTVPGFGYFHLLIDDVDVSGRVPVKGTGGWQNWTPLPITGVHLNPGIHRMRYEFGSDSDKKGWLFSLNHTRVDLERAVSTQDDPAGGAESPVRFALLPNRPNPFNPSTAIPFTLARSGHVRLEVFNLQGRRVRTLADRSMAQGSHTVVFSADGLASGVYLVRLQASEGVLTRRIVLLK